MQQQDDNQLPEELDGVLPEIEYSSLQFHEQLSAGTYGAVYRATWNPSGRVVAVKRLLVLEKEAHILSLIRHRNIVQFYGAVSKPPNFCIVTEFASRGSLYNVLHDKDNNDISFDLIIQWALDIASGIHYLHFHAPVKIVHRDLKSKNVVIDSRDVCKLCDFGTSRTLLQTTRMSYVGTMPWMSPEMIQSSAVSEATDTWSYGVILWELITREVPFNRLDEFRIAWMVVENGLRLTIPESCPVAFASLMKRCWEKEQRMRPDFEEILIDLTAISCDQSISVETKTFLGMKAEWKAEIQSEVDRLKEMESNLNVKQAKLHEWELRLRKREQNLEYSRRREVPSYDVNVWSEEDVVTWLLKLTINGVTYQQLTELATVFRCQQIIGERLLLLTETDLSHMGVTSPAFQWQLLREITRLKYDNKRLINFPPLSSQNDRMRSSISDDIAPLTNSPSKQQLAVDLKLLFCMYVRLGTGLDSHKWKIVMDVDDDYLLGDYPAITDFDQLIADVCFMVSTPPYVYKVTTAPYVTREWLVGLDGALRVQCVVNFSDHVRQPRNYTFSLDIDFESRGVSVEKRVNLFLRNSLLTPRSTSSSTLSTSGLNELANDSRRLSTATANVLRESSSSNSLAPAWKDRSFSDAVPVLSPPPQSSKKSPLWSQIVSLLQPPSPSSYNGQVRPKPKRHSDTTAVRYNQIRMRAVSHDPNRNHVGHKHAGTVQSLDGSFPCNSTPIPPVSSDSELMKYNTDTAQSVRTPTSTSTPAPAPAPRRGGRVRYPRRPTSGTGTLDSAGNAHWRTNESSNSNNSFTVQQDGIAREASVNGDAAATDATQCSCTSVTSVQVHGGYPKWKWKQKAMGDIGNQGRLNSNDALIA